jgi:cobalt-zinc-cadmium efflux system protein
MLADVVALVISLLAFWLIRKPPNHKASFGYYRAEVIAALFNGVVLLVVSFFIIKEAMMRFFTPAKVEADLMIAIALGGLLINIVGLWLLKEDKSSNVNVHGAWLHVLSDTLSSVGVIISGILIRWLDWQLADPITSIAIACFVSYSALNLVLLTINVLMEHVPIHIDARLVEQAILSVPYASKVHDLHIWSITPGHEALSVHIVLKNGGDFSKLLSDVQEALKKQFGIAHTTIQIETES